MAIIGRRNFNALDDFIAEHDALQFLLAHEPDAVLPHVAFDKLTRVFRAAAAFAQPHLARFLPEEEVPRAGALVTQRFRRTRWRDGRAWLWLGVRKQTGRGEGSSGLAFDQILDLPSGP